MKLVALSDTHNTHKNIKVFQDFDSTLNEDKEPLGGDIIIHAGDATGRGEFNEVKDFLEWYGKLDFRYIIFTPGNHDFLFEKNPTLCRQLCKDNGIILLNHESIEIEGIKIFGSPWTPYFFDWAFNGGRTQAEALLYRKPLLKDLWKDIPNDTDILVTHGPPYEILDELHYVNGTPKGQFVGCVDLKEKILEVKPDLHIFGHIHCQHGEMHQNGTSFYNVAICDEMYYPSNAIREVEYEKDSSLSR